MSSWPRVCLGDLCVVKSGGTPSRTVASSFGGDIPWVKIGDMLQGRVVTTEERLSPSGLENSAAKVLPAGTVLMSIFATIGRTAILGIDAATNQAIAGITPRDPNVLLPQYLRRFLDHEAPKLEGRARGVAQANINLSLLRAVQIPLPPLPEQRRIAEILGKADALRAKRREAIAKIDGLAQAIFVEMFGDPVTNPMGWPTCLVADFVSEFQGGKSIEADSNEGAASRNRVLKVSAVTGMKFLPQESKPLPDSYSPPSEHFVRQGDLLFSRANTTELVGAVAFVEETPSNLLLPDKIWRFIWREPILVEPLFVWALFQTDAMRFEVGRRATGTSGSMKNISQEKLLGIRTILPDIDVQRSFARSLIKVEKLRVANRVALSELDALFCSLQTRVFRGDRRL